MLRHGEISDIFYKEVTNQMRKRILAIVLALLIALSVVPGAALAAGGDDNVRAGTQSGTVYISISDDEDYVVSDGEETGTIMAYVPVDLEEVSRINLADYGLERYAYDEDGNGENDITVLHLFLYVLDKYYSGKAASLQLGSSSSPGSLYMTSFWGHDANLTYWVDGMYPLQKDNPGMGSTSDRQVLEDGTYVDVTMYSNWNFYTDANAGYHYFMDADKQIVHECAAEAGTVNGLYDGMGKLQGDYSTYYEFSPGSTVYYSQTMYDEDASSVTVGGDGAAELLFQPPARGTYGVREKKEQR